MLLVSGKRKKNKIKIKTDFCYMLRKKIYQEGDSYMCMCVHVVKFK